MDKQVIFERLVSEFGYPSKGAWMIVERLNTLDPALQQGFAAWFDGGLIPDLAIEGYTIDRLMNEHGMNVIAAFLTQDWLAREPERAIASLKKGHDKVDRSSK